MIFKTTAANLPQIKAVVDTFGICYVHGDGNMYTTEGPSNFRKDFSNPKQEESKYRVIFKKGDAIPATVDALNEALMASRNKEILAERETKIVSPVQTITVPEPEDAKKKTDGGKAAAATK
jgi:hypothetical protein